MLLDSSSSFDQRFVPVSNADLFFAIGKYEYTLSLTRKSGEIYTIVTFHDKYDFPGDADYGYNLTDSLNSLGYYYQSNLSGNTYEWDSIIKIEIQQ